MHITILNGNPNPDNKAFDDTLQELVKRLPAEHTVTLLTLREMDIKYCVGCFGCWVKTPGECVARDASADVCRAAINADLLILASPMIMGFVSSLLKKANDKLIPLIHPYFDVVEGEAHHRARYDRYPLLGLFLEKSPGTDDEDIAITTDIYRRTALNLKSRLAFAHLIQNPIEEVVDAIDRL